MNSQHQLLDSAYPTDMLLSTKPLEPFRPLRPLPPDIIIKVISHLPVPAITNFALASRRFKVLAYDDEIWESKLRLMNLWTDTTPSNTTPDPLPRIQTTLRRTPSTASTTSVTSPTSPSALALASLTAPAATHTRTMVKPPRNAATPAAASSNIMLMDQSESFMINNKPLNSLIPGLSTDPFTARARAKSTGRAREQFKEAYTGLIPFYVDFRNTHKDAKVLKEYGGDPIECARVLAKLVGLGKCKVVEDWRKLNEGVDNICQYFESASLHQFELAYDSQNVDDMHKYATCLIELNGGQACVQTFIQKHPMFFDNPFDPLANFSTIPPNEKPLTEFMKAMEDELRTQSRLIGEVFPENADVYYMFAERMFEDVITEYVTTLLDYAYHKETLLYLTTTSLVFKMSMHLAHVMMTTKPVTLDKARAQGFVFRMYEPLMERYLEKEGEYIKASYKAAIEGWINMKRKSTVLESERHITNQSREVYKRNYLSAFRKLIALPVDLVSSAANSAATTISSAANSAATTISSIASTKTRSEAPSPSLSPSPSMEDLTRIASPTSPTSSTVTTASSTTSWRKPAAGPVDKMQQEQALTRRASLSRESQYSRTSREFSAVELQGALNYARIELDQLQNLLSLDMALQMIHLNKEAERRLERFMLDKFRGDSAVKTQKTFESVYVALLKSLGPQHVQPGFNYATERLSLYKPDPESLGQEDVAPLRQFFELVHIADLIQQMLDVYYDEEIVKFVDRQDFMNEVNKEKKLFERLLDDCVANGLDRTIQVLMDQCEFILSHEQKPSDYNPSEERDLDVKPSKACLAVIRCLNTHTKLLIGCTDRHTLDVFFQEIARRFFEVLCKHLKRQTVNEQGGFLLMCDLNSYHGFVQSLHQSPVLPYYAALKSLANIYIVSSPSAIKDVIHDMERFNGALRVEDVFEFATCRADWQQIKKEVEKERIECSIM